MEPTDPKRNEPAPLSDKIRPWKQVGSRPIGDFRIFSLREDTLVSPRTGVEHGFYILDTPHWVNVVATTPDRRIVMIEQYRHGSQTVELEIPGGMIDPHDSSPTEAGVRELREETGYGGENARVIGKVFANPAILTNTCFTVLVENCTPKHPLNWDHGEDLVTRLVPIDDIPHLVSRGRIGHSLVVVALGYFDLWQRGFMSEK